MKTYLTRQHVLEQINALSRGQLSAPAVAAWAFNQFYAVEAGTLAYETGHEQLLAAILDDLMFADSLAWQLTPEAVEQVRHMLHHERTDDTNS